MCSSDLAGAVAVFAFPLFASDVCFGVLELYRRTPGDLDDEARLTVEATRDAIVRIALEELLGPDATTARPHSWPAQLTAAHAGVHQAAGMVAVQLEVSLETAMARLRAQAYSEGATLTELATRVLAGSTRLDKDPPS